MNDEILTLKEVLEGKDIEEPVYPAFINEAAYYEKDLAFWLTLPKLIQLPSIAANKF